MSLQKPFSYTVLMNEGVVAEDLARRLFRIDEIDGINGMVLGDTPNCQNFLDS